jgi:hypothetical protein
MSQVIRAAVEPPPSATERLSKKQKELDNASQAMQALLELLGNEDVPMEGGFAHIRNMSDLVQTLLSEGLFGAATALFRLNKTLTPEIIVSAIVSLPTATPINPHHYIPLLESGILGLSAKHSLLPTINAWACRTADALVPDLDAAFFLLQHVNNAINQLQARIYSSFASFCPFVDVTPGLLSPRSTDTSRSFRSCDSSNLPSNKQKITVNETVPTILELGKLKGGAMKRHELARHVDDDYCDDIEVKLRHVKVLRISRELGLKNVDLLNYVRKGGARPVARALVRLIRGTLLRTNRGSNHYTPRSSLFVTILMYV